MEIKIVSTNQGDQFNASNGIARLTVGTNVDSTQNSNFQPLELMLISLGTCMSTDVLSSLTEQRQKIIHFHLEVKAKRRSLKPAIFSHIDLVFYVSGQIKHFKLSQAIDASRQKYSSVYKIISPSTIINIKYQLNNATATI